MLRRKIRPRRLLRWTRAARFPLRPTLPPQRLQPIRLIPPLAGRLPVGWKQLPGSSMRFATILVDPNDPKAELTVVPLGAEASGTLGNVSRWAGQLKLPAVTETDLPKYVTQTQVSGEQSQIVDLTGSPETGNPPTRLLAAIVPHAGATWFFTLKAPAPLVEAAESQFRNADSLDPVPRGRSRAVAGGSRGYTSTADDRCRAHGSSRPAIQARFVSSSRRLDRNARLQRHARDVVPHRHRR